VLCPADRLDALRAAVTAAVGPAAGSGDDSGLGPTADDADLERPVVVLTVREAKGLEFDSVLVADPAKIIAESVHGQGDLYVALTRATQRVGVIYTGALPSVLTGLTAITTPADAIGPATGESAPAA
jgi:superfamily I DNA/RNA helicase